MHVELHPAARRELHAAMDWYLANADKATAMRLAAEFERAEAILRERPQIGAVIAGRVRRVVFAGFPYVLIYRAEPARVTILAFAHQSREPNYWAVRQ